MIPLSDDNKFNRGSIIATYFLIVINSVIFFFIQDPSGATSDFTEKYSLLPVEMFSGRDIVIDGYFVTSPYPVYLTLITSMFLHGDWLHLLGNMFFLYIFGDNLESVMGGRKFVLFYFVCGLIASVLNLVLVLLFDQNQYVLNLGASGAISGLVGGYLMLFPRNTLYMVPFAGFYISTKAFIWGAMWIATQIIGCINLFFDQGGGVAYGAHLGGAIAGFLLSKYFLNKKTAQKAPAGA